MALSVVNIDPTSKQQKSLLDQTEVTSVLSKVHSLLLLSLIGSNGDLILVGATGACTFGHDLRDAACGDVVYEYVLRAVRKTTGLLDTAD